jgi:hypothetical protein|tara:strand:+ start:278 stop:769 length:492 start_codon:yes stop_codon:yes gene_type:complete
VKNKTKLISNLFVGVLFMTPLFPQANTVYFELFGNGLLYSVNYDRMITDNISVRAGYGGLSVSSASTMEDVKITMMPVLGNYLMGGGNHKLEIGAGIVLVSVDYSDNIEDVDFSLGADGSIPTGNLGYRYQKPEGGLFFKASLCPFFADEMVTSFGLGIGWSF